MFLESQQWERAGAEAEAPILKSPDAKSKLTTKDPDAGKDWGQEEKQVAEDETVRQHHQLNGHEFEQTLGDGEGQRSLVCCSPWGCKESDTTEWLNNRALPPLCGAFCSKMVLASLPPVLRSSSIQALFSWVSLCLLIVALPLRPEWHPYLATHCTFSISNHSYWQCYIFKKHLRWHIYFFMQTNLCPHPHSPSEISVWNLQSPFWEEGIIFS